MEINKTKKKCSICKTATLETPAEKKIGECVGCRYKPVGELKRKIKKDEVFFINITKIVLVIFTALAYYFAFSMNDNSTLKPVFLIIAIILSMCLLVPFFFSQSAKDTRTELNRRSGDQHILCPNCNTRGSVQTEIIDQKKGISGGKATAAVLTGGISVIATGLSRKERCTKAYCTKCKSTWIF